MLHRFVSYGSPGGDPSGRLPRAAPAAILAPLALAFAGALWVWLDRSACDACRAASADLGFSLGMVGSLYYSALLTLGILAGRGRLFDAGVLVAASTHLALLGVLAAHRVLCPPCLLAAAGALAAGAGVLRRDPQGYPRAAAIMLVTLLSANSVLAWLQQQRVADDQELAREFAGVVLTENEGAAAQRPRVVAYTHPQCPPCRALNETHLPGLRSEFGRRVEVVERRPQRGLPVPLVIVKGRSSSLFLAPPEGEALRQAVRRALEGTQAAPLPRGAEVITPAEMMPAVPLSDPVAHPAAANGRQDGTR